MCYYLLHSYQLHVCHPWLCTNIVVLCVNIQQYATNPTRNAHTSRHTYIYTCTDTHACINTYIQEIYVYVSIRVCLYILKNIYDYILYFFIIYPCFMIYIYTHIYVYICMFSTLYRDEWMTMHLMLALNKDNDTRAKQILIKSLCV